MQSDHHTDYHPEAMGGFVRHWKDRSTSPANASSCVCSMSCNVQDTSALYLMSMSSIKRLIIVLVLIFIPGGVSGQLESCDKAYECVGQSRPTDPTVNFRSYGYKATSGGSTDITIDWFNQTSPWIRCSGSFGCANIAYIKMSARSSSNPLLSCEGVFACSNTTINFTGNINVCCYGSNSCYGVTLNSLSHTMWCSGDRSCANAEVHSNGQIKAHGSYALYNATIHSAIDELLVYLYGSNAGFGASIFCHLGHSCEIYCYATGCNMLYISCEGVCDVQMNSMDTVHPITCDPSGCNSPYNIPDKWASYYAKDLLYDSSALAKSINDACEIESSLDDFQSPASTVLIEGNVCCRGSNACEGLDIESPTSVECSGSWSCHSSTSIFAYDELFCSATYGCYNAMISSMNDVYCLGMSACAKTDIQSAHYLYCAGYHSCKEAIIEDVGYIYFSGYMSGYGASIHCSGEGWVPNIICEGYDSCRYITSVTNCDGFTASCDHDTGCPPGYTLTPTTLVLAPTSLPSFSSLTPTQEPTCMDFHSTGDEINVMVLVNNITFTHFASSAELIDGSNVATFSSQSIYLNSTLSELHCSGLVSCFQSNIYCASGQTHCNVRCNGTLSCIEAIIHANNTQNAHIICDGEDTCKNVQIYTQNVTAVTVDCVSSSSCTAMHISLHNNTESIISCYLTNSCDDMNIFTTNYNDTQLHLYEYSENIVYDNGYGLEGIHCGTETQYVRYETSLTDTDIR
eukprot:416292_1